MSVPVTRVLAPNPSVYTLEGTNTWVVGRDPAVVIDPGPADAAHIDAVAAEAGRVAAILLTHGHEDHADGAEMLAQRTGALVHAGDASRGIPLVDGEQLDFGDTRIQVVHAPGHTPDHVVFRLPETGAMFTGDAILGRGTSLIDPPEGDLVSYLKTLEHLGELDPKTLFPGHGPTIFAGRLKIQEYLDHRHERDAQIIAALGTDGSSVEDIVAEIYAAYPKEVWPLAERSIVAHLLKLQAESRVEVTRDGGSLRYALVKDRVCSSCGRPVRGKSPLCARCSMDALQEQPK